MDFLAMTKIYKNCIKKRMEVQFEPKLLHFEPGQNSYRN